MNSASSPRSSLPRRKKILFVLLILSLFWGGLEGTAFVAYPRVVKPEVRNFIDYLLHPDRPAGLFVLGFIPHPYTLLYPAPNLVRDGFKQHNSLGFRGPEIALPKPEGVYRILCLGGSTTYSAYVADPEQAYPRQLERILRDKLKTDKIEVVNGGITYATTAELLGTLALRGLQIEPDMVILNEGGNDIEPFLAPGYKPDYSHWRKSWEVPASSVWKRLALQSAAARLLYGVHLTNLPMSVPFQKFPSTTGWDGSRGALEFAQTHEPVGFRNNTETMILMAKGRGMDFVLVNFAFAPQYALKKFPAAEIAYQKNLRIFGELAAQYSIPLVHFEQNHIPPEHWTDKPAWCHLDAEGDRLKAEFIAPEVLSRLALRFQK